MLYPVFFFIIVLIIQIVTSHTSSRSELRYFTGEKAKLGQFPYVVYINKTHACSGIILDRQWIMTTADCMVARPGQHHKTEVCTYVSYIC